MSRADDGVTGQVGPLHDGLGKALNAARERLARLEGAGDSDGVLSVALEELRTSFEELRVANEEIRTQCDELEAAAREREIARRRYLELFELAPDAYLVTDPRHHIIEANQAAGVLLCRAPRALAGKPLVTFVPLAERRDFRSRIRTLRAGDSLTNWRFQVQATGGSPAPVSATVSPALDDAGKPRGHRWILRDDTERLQAREAQHESEARYRAIVEHAPQAIITIDAQGIMATVNPAARRIFGYASGEMMGRDVRMLMPAAQQAEWNDHLLRHLTSGERPVPGTGAESRGLRKDGSMFPLHLSVSEFHDGARPLLCVIITDLTASKEHAASQRRFLQMISSSDDLMTFVSRDYVYLAVNEAYARAFGARSEELLGRRVDDVVEHSHYMRVVKPQLDDCLQGHSVHFERWIDLPVSGRRYLDLHYSPHFDEDGTVAGVVVDARDRTEIKLLEGEAEQRQAELAHVSRLSMLGELASGLAHELNQPLSAVASYCDGARRLVQRGTAEPQMLVQTLEACSAQARRAGEIIRRLRRLVRRDPGERAPAAVNDLVREVLHLMDNEIARRRVEVELDLAADLPPAVVDRVQIEQVVLNLVRNAIDAIDESGSALRWIGVHSARGDQGEVQVRVADSGTGLSAEVARVLFDPFFSTKQDGMGIGLAICRTIVESHGGAITAQNRPEGGALFCLTLPAQRRGQGG